MATLNANNAAVSNALSVEIDTTDEEVRSLTTRVSNEESRAKAAEGAISNELVTKVGELEAADAAINVDLTSLEARVASDEGDLAAHITFQGTVAQFSTVLEANVITLV